MSEDRKVLTCVKCGAVSHYSNDMRDIAARNCQRVVGHRQLKENVVPITCGGMLYHVSAFRLGAWKLRTGQTSVCVTGHIDKRTLVKRMLQGGGVA